MSSSRQSEVPSESLIGPGDPGKAYRAASGIPVVPCLDGFRALAVLGIMFFHLTGTPDGEALRIMKYGIGPNFLDVLFVVSGFVLFLPAAARNGEFGSVRVFALRRGARLFPGLWVALAMVLVLIVLWPAQPTPSLPGATEVGIHFLSLQAVGHLIDPTFSLGLLLNGPVWTLTLEVTFYALLPFVAATYFRHPIAGLVVAGLITAGWKVGLDHTAGIAGLLGFHPDPASVNAFELRALGQFPTYVFQFAVGMTAAWLLVRLQATRTSTWLAQRAVVAQVLSLAVLGVCAYFFGRYASVTEVLAPTRAQRDIVLMLVLSASVGVFILATCLSPERLQRPFTNPVARGLGDISYGIYLSHFPIFLFVVALLGGAAWGSLEVVLISVPLILLYGYLSARFVELPARRWAHRAARSSQPGKRPIRQAT